MYVNGATVCPLCGHPARVTDERRIHPHIGKQLSVVFGHMPPMCKASLCTPERAREMADAARADLDALRLRAHP